MKKVKRPRTGGYTLIELMMVVTILGLLASNAMPPMDMILQRANQATTKNNLGSIRSAIALYYSNHEGEWPLSGTPDGLAPRDGVTLTQALTPVYIHELPVPRLLERVDGFNGFDGSSYDIEAKANLAEDPPKDVLIARGPVAYHPLINRPWAYNPIEGHLYICNGNYDVSGEYFYSW